MKRDGRITIRVSDEEKEEIEGWVKEDPNFSSKSQFLRAAARSYATGDDASVNQEEVAEAVDVGLSPLQEELEQIKDRLASIEVATQDPDDEITRLTEQIVEELPVHESEDDLPHVAQDIPEDLREGTVRAARYLSNPTSWAEYYDRDVSDVREALSLAHSWYPEVKYTIIGYGSRETRRWYKTRELHDHGRD